jgi:hypothetical protein
MHKYVCLAAVVVLLTAICCVLLLLNVALSNACESCPCFFNEYMIQRWLCFATFIHTLNTVLSCVAFECTSFTTTEPLGFPSDVLVLLYACL